jgi:hypothetical protein
MEKVYPTAARDAKRPPERDVLRRYVALRPARFFVVTANI